MGRIRNIWDAITGKDKTSADIKPTGYEAASYGFGYGDNSKIKEYLQEMRGWVYSAVSAIADEIGSIELKLYKTTKNGVEEIKDHDILDSLYKVNNFTTKFDHFWLTTAYLELTGEAPWFLEKKGNKVVGIYFLQPDRIEPIPDKAQMIKGYRYDVGGGEKVTLQPEEVIFLKNPNPANPFRGLGTLQGAARAVDVDNYSEEWNKKFFENSARPDAILKVPTDTMTEQQKEKLKASIRKAYSGTERAHNLMVLFGEMAYEKFSTTQKDMDFLEQQKFYRDKILGLFRVPKAIVSQTEGVNFASAQTAQYTFARWTIQPKMERLVQQLNEFYVPLFANSDNLFLDYVNPIPSDDAAKLEKLKAGVNVWITINEAREQEGLVPLGVEGDRLYVPISNIPVDAENPILSSTQAITIPRPTDQTQEAVKKIKPERIKQVHARSKIYYKVEKVKSEIKEAIKKELKKEILEKRRKNKILRTKTVELSAEKKLEFWQIKNKLYNQYRKEVEEAMVKVFKDEEDRVLAELEEQKSIRMQKKVNVDKLLLDPKVETELTEKEVLPILKRLFKKAADDTFAFIGVDLQMDLDAPTISKMLLADNRKFTKAATDTTNEKIANAVAEGIENGEGINKIKERIETAVFGTEAVNARAELIAKTETLRYNVNATEEAFKQSGVVAAKQWQVDGNPCEQCIALNGKIVDLDDNFLDKGDLTATGVKVDYADVSGPPLHPNCECDLVPVYFSK